MQIFKKVSLQVVGLMLFWVLLFDFQRIIFSIHHWDKLAEISWLEWLLTFVYSIKVDVSMAAYLTVLPLLLSVIHLIFQKKWTKFLARFILLFEALIVVLIHAGEINAYTEWNHKLTSRVFMHLSNPDEVFRTADQSMTLWFIVYSILEWTFAYRMMKWLLKFDFSSVLAKKLPKIVVGTLSFIIYIPVLFLIMRGGIQPIPLNIDGAYFSRKPIVNDLSVNSTYFFINSYILYSNSDLDKYMPDISLDVATKIVDEMYDFPKEHSISILENEKPNVVFVILESWAAEAVGVLNGGNGATPYFDELTKKGLLFTQIYSVSNTSEKGNSAIFSGYPAIPGLAITSHPEKHRKIATLNEDLKMWGYNSNYIFSGDLKYGNIGSYFMEHGFDDVKDEKDFPRDLERGKLNYFDEDLYSIFLKRINNSKEPFLQCAFTGSTHSPYDYPKSGKEPWTGDEANFMNSVVYADKSLHDFVENCKNQPWFDNTLFVFVADHGHGTPNVMGAHSNDFYRIPLLIWGKPLKKDFEGKRIDKVGSQVDIPATLLYQMGGDISRYPWSKDLLNPNVPEFAFHTIIEGYGFVTDKGKLAFHNGMNGYLTEEYEGSDEDIQKSKAFLKMVYESYKNL